MSGFSAEWLALREPADRRARNPGIAGMLRDSFAGAGPVAVCDLGSGTGASLRALAGSLPPRQSWTLVDHDPALLAAARDRLAEWADAAEADPDGRRLRLRKGGHDLRVDLVQADLRGDLDALLPAAVDLVSASALIDLVSEAWLDGLVPAAARRGAALVIALSYAGIERWQPPHPADAAVLAAFNAHQQRPKSFGPALGPRAAETLARKLKGVGYEVVLGPSTWQLAAPRDAALMAALARGIAEAAIETGQVPADLANAWARARREARAAEIGHIDLFARLP